MTYRVSDLDGWMTAPDSSGVEQHDFLDTTSSSFTQ